MLESDPGLRDDVRALGEEMVRMAEAATPALEPLRAPEPEPLPAFDIGQDAREPTAPPPTLAWSNDPAYAPGDEAANPFARLEEVKPDPGAIMDDELPRIEHRSRLKAEACRWALERRERLANGAEFQAEIRPIDEDIIARAKDIHDCFLWMCGAVEPRDDNHGDWEIAAEAFDNLAAVTALLRDVVPHRTEDPDIYKAAVNLMAECQSAVREAVERIGADADSDQDKAFHWLRRVTREESIFIDRHMRDSDRAEPADWEARREQIAACALTFSSGRMRQKQTKDLFSRLKYHVNKLEGARPDARGHHTLKISESVNDLVASGLPPSNRDLRDLLYPVLDLLPDGAGENSGYRRTIEELYRFLESVPVASQTGAEEEFSSEVEEVRPLLAGKTVVLIGGDPRPDAAETLKRAFDLGHLDWVPSNKHQSYYEFRPHIARDEVAVVLLAIRWASHSFANVKAFCDETGKPLVRLPAGYGANQVARQVLEQVAGRLHA
jgi:hypothetical protein